MTRLTRLLRNFIQRRLQIFYDGPQPPRRLDQAVDFFAKLYPQADHSLWTHFAKEHANEAYRVGYIRGLEYAERDPEERQAIESANPGKLASRLDPDWEWTPPVLLGEPGRHKDEP